MGFEIERKFLLTGDGWRELGVGRLYRQGYMVSDGKRTVRVRTKGESGWLTIKGPSDNGVRREYEYEIPLTDALYMLKNLCRQPLIEKRRYKVEIPPFTWEIDEFFGENEGLLLAEVELESRNQPITLPEWIGRDVTHEGRYYNAHLVSYPYSAWSEAEKAGE